VVADGALVERALDALIRKGKVPGGKAYGYDWPTSIAASSTWSWSKRSIGSDASSPTSPISTIAWPRTTRRLIASSLHEHRSSF
jgi:hypothetical protein